MVQKIIIFILELSPSEDKMPVIYNSKPPAHSQTMQENRYVMKLGMNQYEEHRYLKQNKTFEGSMRLSAYFPAKSF
jgi:hypothetical protein